MYEKVLELTTPKVKFEKEDVVRAIKEFGSTKAVAILYAHTGERYLALGETKHCPARNDITFLVEEVMIGFGEVERMYSYDALGACSKFMGVKILVSRGLVRNELKTSCSLFINENALLTALQIAAA